MLTSSLLNTQLTHTYIQVHRALPERGLADRDATLLATATPKPS